LKAIINNMQLAETRIYFRHSYHIETNLLPLSYSI